MQYPLDRDDVVIDVGGFEGQWSSDIFSRYLCRIHIFEPIPEFAAQISERFAANDKITLHRCALGPIARTSTISVRGDASSQVAGHQGAHCVEIQTTTLKAIIDAEGIGEIALMKINIEGAEYEFLEDVIASGLVRSIRDLQIQFHDFIPDAKKRMEAIQMALSRTHQPTWQFYFTWENWQRLEVAK